MRVLFVVGRFPRISESFVIDEAAGVLSRGHHVSIYAVDGPSEEAFAHPALRGHRLTDGTMHGRPLPPGYGARVLSAIRTLKDTPSRERRRVLRLLDPIRYGRAAASLRLLHQGAHLAGRGAFDVIHCQFGSLGRLALRLRDSGIVSGRILTTFRGGDISWQLRAHGPRVYDDLFRRGDYFLTNCAFFERRLLELGCDAARLERHVTGIDVERFAYRPRAAPVDGRVRLVTVGRLVEKKGIAYAIRAAAALHAEGVPLTYRIAGDGPLRPALSSLIAELGVGHAVHLCGPMDQERLVRLLDHSDVFIGPSVTAGNGDQDAPTNVLKEAMAMGLPVVSTRHGGIPELVEDGRSGYLVGERDAGAIAAALKRLIAAPEGWAAMGAAGRARVAANYNLAQQNDRLVEIYTALAASPERPSSLCSPTS